MCTVTKDYNSCQSFCFQVYAQKSFHTMRMQGYSAKQHFWIYVQDKIYARLDRASIKLYDELKQVEELKNGVSIRWNKYV
jgi:hypothetical protein